MLGFILIVVPISIACIVIVSNLISDINEFVDPHDWDDIFDGQYDEWDDGDG